MKVFILSIIALLLLFALPLQAIEVVSVDPELVTCVEAAMADESGYEVDISEAIEYCNLPQ